MFLIRSACTYPFNYFLEKNTHIYKCTTHKQNKKRKKNNDKKKNKMDTCVLHLSPTIRKI